MITDLSPQELQNAAQREGMSVEDLKKSEDSDQLKRRVTKQEQGIEALASQLEEQAATIRRVTTQLELTKPLPQNVADGR